MSNGADSGELPSEADRHLLGLIRAGDADGWNQFVQRYERRLIAFACGRVDQTATAQDLVQETLLAFLKSLETYRSQGSLESFLFRILRRRIVDHYRSSGHQKAIHACDITEASLDSGLEQVASRGLTASQHVRRDEQIERDQVTLGNAIAKVTLELRETQRFRDLKIAEGLFYAGLRNQHLATLLDLPPSEIGVIKHRLIKKLSECVSDGATNESVVHEADLSAAWELHRPSCPKRSTLGKYELSILPDDWTDFVHFHVQTLGCRYCNANLTELQAITEAPHRSSELFQSTIGFLPARGQE